MKNGFIIFNLLLLLASLSCNQENAVSSTNSHDPDQISSKVKVEVSWGGANYQDSLKVYYVVGRIMNTGKDTIHIQSMSCSWDKFWRLESKFVKKKQRICFGNVPWTISIPPQHSITHYLELESSQSWAETKEDAIKIGYELISLDSKEIESPTSKVIWAENLKVSELSVFNTIKPLGQ